MFATHNTFAEADLRRRLAAWFALIALMTSFVVALSPGTVNAASIGGTLNQWANVANTWTTGNLNRTGANASLFYEGETVPFRLELSNLAPNEQHTVVIEWDTTKGGKHAYDYLRTYNVDHDPTNGVPAGTPDTIAIPQDGRITPHISQQGGNFTLFGGEFDSVGAYSYPVDTGFAGDTKARIPVTFTTGSNTSATLLWGGHIASQFDWGSGNAASNISGSPYHMRALSVNGSSIGNQDRSLKSDAVLPIAPVLSLQKSADESTIDIGDQVTYTIVVGNDQGSNQTAQSVVVTDTVPSEFDNITASFKNPSVTGTTTNCSVVGQDVTCNVGSLAPGVTATVTIVADAIECGLTENNAEVFFGGDTNAADADSAEVTIENCFFDVTLEKEATETTVGLGDTFSYTLTAENHEDATIIAEDVVIEDTVPSVFSILDATFVSPDDADGECDIDGQSVTCEVGDLAPGEQAVATIDVEVTTAADTCGDYTNDGEVWVDGELEDEDSVEVTIEGCEFDVSLDKDASEETVALGGSFDYTITATNDEDATATAPDVVITDEVPDAFSIDSATFVSPDDDEGECDVTGQSVTCEVGDLGPGESAIVTISVTVDVVADSCDTYRNAAEVFVDDAEDPEDTAWVDVETTGCDFDVTLDKDASEETVALGGSFDYTITATNDEDATATAPDVVITDEVPDAFSIDSATFVSPDDDEGECDVTGQSVTCEVGDLGPGESAIVTIAVTVDVVADSCDVYTNDAEVFVADGDDAEDSASVNVETTGCDFDLTFTKEASEEQAEPGQSFSYTLTASNDDDATATATDVVITDDVPSELGIVSASFTSPGGPGSCDVSGQGVTCDVGDLGPGETAVATIVVTVIEEDVEDACGETVTNDATLSVGDEVIDEASADVLIVCGSILLEKSANTDLVAAGDVILYTFTVTNTGDVTLTDVSIDDPFLLATFGPIELESTTLEPGGSTTGTASYVVTPADVAEGEILNVATATGVTPAGNEVNWTDEALVETEFVAVLPSEQVRPAPIVTQAPAPALPRTGLDVLRLLVAALLALSMGTAIIRRFRNEGEITP